ncbi:F-box domain, Leucine-rich repeat domain, L domain-like protein [Artemisia annua]|uniref:F-box domain, Leucine-rich repeat domain, L domain-like protein n=1 Tax=Artemisia annua TaxID=35608 RepID=A0A2U1P644_ARTAN|nr:F-box domain, Leucine-rich repeat domain, L domain-like protein [Artemisia annua]
MKKRNVKTKKDTTDRISELPECIIENILLRLDHPKERVRVSVLSKKWFDLTASLPVLEFSSSDFWKNCGRLCSSDVRDSFYKYIEHTVSIFCRQQNVMNAHTFKVCTEYWSTIAELKIINACLELILQKGVKALEIMIQGSTYRLPDILTSASSLTSLKVYHCMLPSSLMVEVANFKSLKVLQLNNVHLDPLVIKHLTASCPLLEELIVKFCYGLKKFCVYGQLQNLKKAHFFSKGEFERIDIETPNLCEFQLCVGYGKGRGATSVNLGLCKQLRTLCLCGSFFPTSTGLSDFLSNFPILENLCLANPCNSLAISSPSLRKFVLYDKCDLEDLDLITPNMLLFRYANAWNSNSEEIIKFDSSESNARMECHIENDVDTLWFQKLRRFLEKSDRFKVLNLHDHRFGKISLDFEQPKVIQLPPYELEHVNLEWSDRYYEWSTVVDAILWCFHPRSLSLTSNFSSISYWKRSQILKFISAKLLQQEDKGQTNIRIEWSFPSKAKIYFSWKSMRPELRYHNEQTLTFIKEEGLNSCQVEERKETVKGLQLLRLCDPLNREILRYTTMEVI